MKYSIIAIIACSLFSTSHATVVVNSDGSTGTTATTSITFGPSANTVFTTTNITDDTVRATIAYGTTLLTNGVSGYTSPTIKGRFYINAIYDTTQTNGIQSTWGSLNHTAGPPASDIFTFRRPGNGGSSTTYASTVRGVIRSIPEAASRLIALMLSTSPAS